MRKLKLVTLGMIIAVSGIVSCKKGTNSKSPDNPKLKSKMDSVSYALGKAIGESLKVNLSISDSTGLNYEIIKIAMQRSIAGDSVIMDDNKVREIMGGFENGQMAIREAEMQKKEIERQKKEDEMIKKNAPAIAAQEKLGAEFLAKNKMDGSVVTTATGLQYKIMKAGKGAKPTATDKVKVHYTGKLLDGKVFDSSVQRGTPAVFGVNQVIPGWTEALQLMPIGSKWELYIPSALAYGPQGNGGIPGGSTLIFEVELLGIEK